MNVLSHGYIINNLLFCVSQLRLCRPGPTARAGPPGEEGGGDAVPLAGTERRGREPTADAGHKVSLITGSMVKMNSLFACLFIDGFMSGRCYFFTSN